MINMETIFVIKMPLKVNPQWIDYQRCIHERVSEAFKSAEERINGLTFERIIHSGDGFYITHDYGVPLGNFFN